MAATQKLTIEIDTKGNVTGLTKAGKGMENLGKKTSKLGGILKKGAIKLTKLGLAAGATGLGAGLVYSIKKAADFESSMNRVLALTGATESDFAKLKSTARDLGRTTAFSATEAAEGMQFLAQKGFDTTQIIGAMPGVLDLAAGAQMELGETAAIASGLLNTFGIAAKDSARVTDILALTSSSSGTDVRQLGEAMHFVGPVAKQLGISLEETSAAIGILGDAEITGSLAGTALGTSLQRLADPTNTMLEGMEAANVEFFDAQGNFKGLTTVVGDLQKGMGGMTKEQRAQTISQIFGARAFKQWSTLIEAGPEKLSEFTGALEDSEGAADTLATTQLKGLTGTMKILMSVVESVGITIGNVLNPFLNRGAEALSNFLQKAEGSGAIQEIFSKIGDAIGSIDWKGIMATITNAFTTLWNKVSPILQAWWNNIGTKIVPMLQTLWEVAKPIIEGIMEGFGKAWNKISEAAGKYIEAVGKVIDKLQEFWDSNKSWIIPTLEFVGKIIGWLAGTVIKNMINSITWLVTAFGWIIDIVSGVVEAVKWVVKAFKATAEGAVKAWKWLNDKLLEGWNWVNDNVLTPMVEGMAQAWEWIKTTFMTGWNWIKDNVLTPIGTVLYALFVWPWKVAVAFIQEYWEEIKAVVLENWNWLVQDVLTPIGEILFRLFVQPWITAWGWLQQIWEWIKQTVAENWNWLVQDVLIPIGQLVMQYLVQPWIDAWGWIQSAWETIKTAVSTGWNWIKSNVLAPIAGFVMNSLVAPFQRAADGAGNAFDGLKNRLSGIWDSVKSMMRTGANGVIGVVNGMIRSLNGLSISVPDWVPDIGGKDFGFNIPEIPQFAKGTPFVEKDMTAQIHKGEAIIPAKNNPMNAGASDPIGGGEQTVNNYFDKLVLPNVTNYDEFKQRLARDNQVASMGMNPSFG